MREKLWKKKKMTPPKTRRDIDFHWDLDRLEAGIKPPDPKNALEGEDLVSLIEKVDKPGRRALPGEGASNINLGRIEELNENPMEALHGFEGARLLRTER